MLVEGVQRLQNAGFQIHAVNGGAFCKLLHLAIIIDAITGTQGHQAVVGLVISQVADHELCHALIGQQGDMGHDCPGICNDGALEGLGIQGEEIVLLIEAVNHVVDGGNGSGDGLLHALGQVGHLGHITPADVGPASVRHIVGQEAGVATQDRDYAGTLHGGDAIGDGSGDGGGAHGTGGDHTVLIHSGDLFIGGGPDHTVR